VGEAGGVRDNPERARFELPLGEAGVAFIDYRDRPVPPGAARVRILTHAEVPPALRGAGIGARLARGTLELIRARGELAVPRCPFVVDFLRRHPEYIDLVADR
jgi:uncharacterized protein